MTKRKLSVLIIDDCEDDAFLLSRHLQKSFAAVAMQRVDHLETLHTQLTHQTWDIILCDMKMPSLDVGLVLKTLANHDVDTPLLVVSGQVNMDEAISLMHAGAKDFVRKDDLLRLVPSIERALDEHQVRLEKKQAIADLHQAKDEAERANRAKSDFLMVMNHELRTPLHGIIGMLDLLAEDTRSWDSERREFLQAARDSSKSLRTLINDILDLTAAESGHLTLNQAHFDLTACLKGALAPFLLAGKDKGIDFSFSMKALPRLVMGDEVRFRQVVLNLVGNAMKFTDQGMIEVKAEMKYDGQGQSLLHFSVKDTGYGIAKERLNEVFQPFVQFRNAGKQQQVGTGLGTSIIKQFIEMMHGQVWVKSTLGEGSCFSFEIPLTVVNSTQSRTERRSNQAEHRSIPPVGPPHAETSSPAPAAKIAAQPSTRLLLAEDDPVSQKVAERRLTRAGFKVDIANDGTEAWQLLLQDGFQYDILLTDLRMPGLDGISLAKKLRQHEQQHQLQPCIIIGLSAHALREVKEECLAVGMNEFLSKPVAAEKVIALIQQTLNKVGHATQVTGE